ncbi:hypothetical protein HK096_009048 [Nowakowskiella sp. JEL0078]|nr:hypothetical protein HK096_009048 [Nowakowskiella sp. JEL0078]
MIKSQWCLLLWFFVVSVYAQVDLTSLSNILQTITATSTSASSVPSSSSVSITLSQTISQTTTAVSLTTTVVTTTVARTTTARSSTTTVSLTTRPASTSASTTTPGKTTIVRSFSVSGSVTVTIDLYLPYTDTIDFNNIWPYFVLGGGVLFAAIIGIYVFRKWKLRPSQSFQKRMNPNYVDEDLKYGAGPAPIQGFPNLGSSASTVSGDRKSEWMELKDQPAYNQYVEPNRQELHGGYYAGSSYAGSIAGDNHYSTNTSSSGQTAVYGYPQQQPTLYPVSHPYESQQYGR